MSWSGRNDLERSKQFYDALFGTLGAKPAHGREGPTS